MGGGFGLSSQIGALHPAGRLLEKSVPRKMAIVTLSCVLSLLLAGCQASEQGAFDASTTVGGNSETFLIQSAAADFRSHVAPTGVSFRNVHPGVMRGDNGSTVSLICGEFRTSDDVDAWEAFATLHTEGYENWLGAAAASYCHQPNTVLDANRDLADVLGRQYNR